MVLCTSRCVEPLDVTMEPPDMVEATVSAMTLPKPVPLTATAPEPATPIVRAVMESFDTEERLTLPANEVTSEPITSALTVFVMVLPESTPFTATPPVPASSP